MGEEASRSDFAFYTFAVDGGFCTDTSGVKNLVQAQRPSPSGGGKVILGLFEYIERLMTSGLVT